MTAQKKHARWVKWLTICMGLLIGFHAYLPIARQAHWEPFRLAYYVLDLMLGAKPDTELIMAYPFLLFARFACPTASAVFLLSVLTSWVDKNLAWLRSLQREFTLFGKTHGRDSAAIYGTNDLVRSAAQGTHFIQAGEKFLPHAKSHIILLDDDEKSLEFYRDHARQLREDSTYIGLQQMASHLMAGIPNVTYFNVYEEVARDYWKQFSLRSPLGQKPQYSVVILGYCRDNLGYQLLKYGLLNNIFRKDQAVTYHIFSKPEEAVRGFEQLAQSGEISEDGMLGDRVVWHTGQWQRRLDILREADRVLLCREINPHILNQLLLTCTQQQIHYYDPLGASYPEKYDYPQLRSFGATGKVLDENSILKCCLHRDAMERNFQYVRDHGSPADKARIEQAGRDGTLEKLKKKLWNELSGFVKNSNIAAADYYTICPVPRALSPEELELRAELEHIRWCRFHFLYGWRNGTPENGARKDPGRRIHRDLVPWEQLPEREKEKDRQQIGVEKKAAKV